MYKPLTKRILEAAAAAIDRTKFRIVRHANGRKGQAAAQRRQRRAANAIAAESRRTNR